MFDCVALGEDKAENFNMMYNPYRMQSFNKLLEFNLGLTFTMTVIRYSL